ncbi:hypothetical protein IQ230_23625 [Gloeocapsopsis crepidinum LEGE 06123]|uniref:Uncharacterized protein n=1 Tax=Gloeocapsopsis crepidinum LEGE 06123 TaxID=588587 RepID=A0ABR9UY84_9CHRO|nr:hypothetical protein [Gloeocapsopsis crepidinum]MBE9193278.1 hypothetical protein [Gloeocapsopsis crepidinum LEGE 06123]
MSRTRRNRNIRASQFFFIFTGITILVWVLRGLGILTFISGGIIWILISLSVITGIWSQLQRN